ncbi:hypothetical protein BDV28DRAFT_73432 [Aspergillus coremiiformis]|uniref:Uncharacterized protein n=1 Tax=Aspergillus coremiiformis TaxID=138285 RepID=A0A5N6ZDA9_9EURO|nr:hypothetical protein BDV28DRAFT_73432 [Aspergillus coremiiformis]
MVAGLVGIQPTSSRATPVPLNDEGTLEESGLHHQGYRSPQRAASLDCLDSIQPVSGWWMYETKDDCGEATQPNPPGPPGFGTFGSGFAGDVSTGQ